MAQARPKYMLVRKFRVTQPVRWFDGVDEPAKIMQLDPHDVECALEEHGRCDTDEFVLIPMEPT